MPVPAEEVREAQEDVEKEKEESLVELMANAEVGSTSSLDSFRKVAKLVKQTTKLKHLGEDDQEVAGQLRALVSDLVVKVYRKAFPSNTPKEDVNKQAQARALAEMCEELRQKVVPHLHELAAHEQAALAPHQHQPMKGVEAQEAGIKESVDAAPAQAAPVRKGGGQAGGSGQTVVHYKQLMDDMQAKVEAMSKLGKSNPATGQPGVNINNPTSLVRVPTRPDRVDWVTIRRTDIPADSRPERGDTEMIEFGIGLIQDQKLCATLR